MVEKEAAEYLKKQVAKGNLPTRALHVLGPLGVIAIKQTNIGDRYGKENR